MYQHTSSCCKMMIPRAYTVVIGVFLVVALLATEVESKPSTRKEKRKEKRKERKEKYVNHDKAEHALFKFLRRGDYRSVCIRGECEVDKHGEYGQHDFSCVCDPGYTGKLCDVDVNECAGNPCMNDATCVDEVNAYRCVCADGYTGENCDIDINDCDPNYCGNGGECVDEVGTFSCNCVIGFSGDLCQINDDDCTPSPCNNGGSCLDEVNAHRCICPPGYTGDNCDTVTCNPNPCYNNGTCSTTDDSFTCQCVNPWTGEICDEEGVCAGNDCNGKGDCFVTDAGTASCKCNVGWRGDDCNTEGDLIRLVGGSRDGEGRVEIFHAGEWGTVCDDFWDVENAIVTCKILGYRIGYHRREAFFGAGVGEIWMDNVKCVGDETALSDCPFNGWGVENCAHSADVGVVCGL